MFDSQIRKLVQAFSLSNTSEFELDQTIKKTSRLLSSNTKYRGYELYENIVQTISELINGNEKKGHETSLYFLEIAQKLQSSPHLTKKSELLQLLKLLSDNCSNDNWSMSYESKTYKNIVETPFANGDIVDELLLIGDILYASQGIETKLIEIRNNEFEAAKNIRLMPSQKRLIRRLCLIGSYHKKLSSFIALNRDYNDINDNENGLVLQSFLGAIDEELTSLYQLFGCLHEKVQQSFDENCKMENKMTLERLNVWFNSSLKRLCLLNKFCSSICGESGGQIISQIYKFCRSGNVFERNLTESILNEICRPIFEMITSWIVCGVLNDPFHEFFIAERDINDIWKKKYILRRKHIPIFINKKLSKQIFCIGRNLNFIRVCCKDNNNLRYFEENIPKSFNISHLNDFFENIHKLSEITNKHLMDLMINKYGVMVHAENLRKYMLLCQGDFVSEFLIKIRDEMNKNASYIKIHDIQSKLESAIFYDDNDIKQRLKVKILPNNGTDIGWNVFTLNYVVQEPINVIFNENIVKKYQKVFVFLIKIKLAKSVLNDCWKDQMRGNHIISVFPDIHYIKHCAYLLRHSMNELLQIFESYFMFDVLNASWKTFKQNANSNNLDMDGLIAAHSKYINEIITKCFLNSNQFNTIYNDILHQIHQFTTIYKELYHSLDKIQSERDNKLLKLESNAITRDSYIESVISLNGDTEYQTQYQLLRKKQNEIIYVLKSFHNKIGKLLQLRKINKIIPEYLERLLVQLDFNDFHNNNNNMFAIDLPINPPPLETFINTLKKTKIKIKNNKDCDHSNADHMLSKLDAVLKPTTKPFVPNFVFPSFTNNENDKNINNKHRTTAPNNSDILSKYDLLETPKIDATIPTHLLPTPLQNKVNSKQKYLFDDSIIDLSSNSRSRSKTQQNNHSVMKRSRSSTPPQQHRFDFIDNGNDNFVETHISSPSGIKFSFSDNRDKIKEMMSPIPFSRNIAKINDTDKDQWNRFIPTPLINQGKKTKSYR